MNTSNRIFTEKLLKKLVSINSVNPEMDIFSSGEYEISQFLRDELKRLGFEVITQPVRTKSRRIRRQNVVAKLRFRGGRKTGSTKTLMFNCHMDTVPATGMTIAPFKPVIRDGYLYGRGSSDMKSGIASCIAAAHSLLDSNQKADGEVFLAFVVGEEYLSMGTEALLRKFKADAAIVGEPSNLELGLAHKGFVWLEVEIFGKPAHGSVPEVGVDAIEKASKLVSYINGDLRSELRKKTHPLVGYPRIHPSLIEGGRAWNIIPDYCKLRIERRTIPGESTLSILKEIGDSIGKIKTTEKDATQRDFQHAISKMFERPPLETSEKEPIVQAIKLAYKKIMKKKLRISGMPYWTDAALLSRIGAIPSVVIGPGRIEEAHTNAEKVSLAQVFAATELYQETILDFLKSQP